MKQFIGITVLSITLGMPAWACTGAGKLVGVITAKDRPGMHVRWCSVSLELPTSYGVIRLGSAEGPKYVHYVTEASFFCDSEIVYQKMAVGSEVVGMVTWSPGMVSRDGSRIECLPNFEPYGVVEKL